MKKILVIDDETEIVKILDLFLRKNGYDVTGISDGNVAMDILHSAAEIDLVVVDIKMPKKSGIEIIQEIKKIGRKIPVVIISGSIGVQDEVDVLEELGYEKLEVLYKPMDLNDLLLAMNKLLGPESR